MTNRPPRNEPPPEVDAFAHQVIGAAIEVHKALGPGFSESVYEQALAIEMGLREIPFSQNHPLSLSYKGHTIGEAHMDFLVGNMLIIELIAVDEMLPIHTTQLLSYLKATRFPLGLIINFNVPTLHQGVRRVVFT